MPDAGHAPEPAYASTVTDDPRAGPQRRAACRAAAAELAVRPGEKDAALIAMADALQARAPRS